MKKNDNYILIVEDSYTQAKTLASILQQMGYPVAIAAHGVEALEFLKGHKTAMVIADILMPEMDGYELCRRIKDDEKLKDIPVMLLTQLSDPKEIVRGLECSADDFIVKPYNEELLISRIRNILAAQPTQDKTRPSVSILVVEDSQTQAEQLKYILEEYGYTVMIALNGKEGLEAARKNRPTLIISDILMPVMDGYELAYEIKHDKELRKTPVILITSLMDRKETLRRASIVADGYFTKPYEDKYLLEKIESLLSISNRAESRDNSAKIEVNFADNKYSIASGRRQILTFLLSTYENAVRQNQDLLLMQKELRALNELLEEKMSDRTKELQESEENFRTLAEKAFDGILIVDKDGNNAYVNRRVSEITGYNADELLKMGMKDLARPEDLQMFRERMRKRLEGMDVPSQYETFLVHNKGDNIPIEISAANTQWHGQPAVVVILRTITERRKREEELLRTGKLESLGVLAGGIAHDFNNLLTGILGNIEFAKTFVTKGDRLHKILSDMESAASRATGLTHQLLTFAKGGMPIKKTSSIAGLLRGSANFALSGSNAKCEFNIAEDLWLLDVDENQINQVINNLVLNGIQAMPKGGTVKITAENISINSKDKIPLKEGRYVKITVSDTGIGISAKDISRVFDPYFTTKEKGSGLGLATVHSIIKNHGGYIHVESKAECGTAFYIYLPASKKKSMPAKTDEATHRGKGRILIMDDEEMIREVCSELLKSLGYETALAKDGAEVIGLYKKAIDSGQPFSAVVMDLTIPGGMGGEDAIKELRKIDPDVKAIVSSGYSDARIMSDYKKYGFKAVIAKPFNLAELSSAVKTVIT